MSTDYTDVTLENGRKYRIREFENSKFSISGWIPSSDMGKGEYCWVTDCNSPEDVQATLLLFSRNAPTRQDPISEKEWEEIDVLLDDPSCPLYRTKGTPSTIVWKRFNMDITLPARCFPIHLRSTVESGFIKVTHLLCEHEIGIRSLMIYLTELCKDS